MQMTFNKPQREYLASTADIVLFGGGAGSGVLAPECTPKG